MKLSTAIATTIALCASTAQSQASRLPTFNVFQLKSGTKCPKPAGEFGEFYSTTEHRFGGLVGGGESDCEKVYFTANTLDGKVNVVPKEGEEFKMMYLARPYVPKEESGIGAAFDAFANYLCAYTEPGKEFLTVPEASYKVIRLHMDGVSGVFCAPLTFKRENSVIKVKRSDPITGRGIDSENWLCMHFPGVVNGKNGNVVASPCTGGSPLTITELGIVDMGSYQMDRGVMHTYFNSISKLGKNYDRFFSTEYALYDVINKQFVTIGTGNAFQMTADKNSATIFSSVASNVVKANEGFVAICAADNRCIRHRGGALYMEPLEPSTSQFAGDFSWQPRDRKYLTADKGVTGMKHFYNDFNGAGYINMNGRKTDDLNEAGIHFVVVPKGLLKENSYVQIVSALETKPGSGYARSNFCVDVAGGRTDSGAPLQMYDCQGPLAQWGNQLFKYDDKQRLVSRHSGKCLDVMGWGSAGAAVGLWDCHDLPNSNQKWTYDDQGRFRPQHALPLHNVDLCLDVGGWNSENGARLIVWHCGDGSVQKFAMPNPVNQFALAVGKLPIKSTTLRMRDNNDLLTVDVEGWNGNDGTRFVNWGFWQGAGQRFQLDHKQRLVNAHTKKCLSVFGARNAAGTGIHQWTCADNAVYPDQQWFYDDKGRLRPFNSPGRCLDPSAGQGGQLVINDCNDDAKFKFARY